VHLKRGATAYGGEDDGGGNEGEWLKLSQDKDHCSKVAKKSALSKQGTRILNLTKDVNQKTGESKGVQARKVQSKRVQQSFFRGHAQGEKPPG